MASMARYLGRMIIGKRVALGWSSSRIVKDLVKTSGSYRRIDMLRDIREIQDVEAFGSKVRDLAVNVRPSQDIMVEMELTRKRKYRVFGRVKTVDIDTGYVRYEIKSFYSDSLRTKEQWGEEFLRQKRISDSDPTVAVEEMDIYAIEHYEGMPY